MPSRYSFAEYSPEWPKAFEREAERLRTLLNDTLVEVHHIGSTSVPGLAAKPIIDLLPVVTQLRELDRLESVMTSAGYNARGEYGISGRRYFTKDEESIRTHNLHFFQQDHSDIERHLAFRDYLRSHNDTRLEYEHLKRKAYDLFPADIEGYNDAKDAWIKDVQKKAVDAYRQRST